MQQFRHLRQIVEGAGDTDHQRRNRNNPDGVGRKPIQPRRQDGRPRTVEQDEPGYPTDTREGRADRRCQKEAQDASRAIEARLDAGDLVAERYVLQVSSPGERPLRTPAEWRRFVGRWANVLAPDFGGRLEGEILSVEDGEEGTSVVLRPERGEAQRIPLAAVREARLAFRFS